MILWRGQSSSACDASVDTRLEEIDIESIPLTLQWQRANLVSTLNVKRLSSDASRAFADCSTQSNLVSLPLYKHEYIDTARRTSGPRPE